MLWRRFFARAKFNHRSIYSRILARVCAVAMGTGLVKSKALKMVFAYLKKIQSLDCFHPFAHYELTLNPFCQHCSNNILT